ncbi:hypothetical protein F5X98DRAFT_22672 [Xylaria grammica]|nr:hypothetical protein F5X98DRAFT_22672 [Xylaria grammica]
MAKKASTELAEYQQKHGTKYESGVPDPNNAMLAMSEEIQRQIAHAIRPHSSSEATKDRSLGHRRSERRRASTVIERTSYPEAWSSPFGPDGTVTDSVEYLPRRRLNRVSFKTSDYTTERQSSDHSMEIRPDSGITQAPNPRRSRSPPVDPLVLTAGNASYTFQRGSSETPGKGVGTQKIVTISTRTGNARFQGNLYCRMYQGNVPNAFTTIYIDRNKLKPAPPPRRSAQYGQRYQGSIIHLAYRTR